jgi:hypothetical protein
MMVEELRVNTSTKKNSKNKNLTPFALPINEYRNLMLSSAVLKGK